MNEQPVAQIDERWFRLPDVIFHPSPLDADIQATPWHVSVSRVADARAKFKVDGSGVRVGILDTGFDRVHVEAGRLPDKLRSFVPGEDGYDYHNHGSHVAGCLLSMAPKTDIRSYKCLNQFGAGDDLWIAKAVDAAVDDGCHIISGSFGSSIPGSFSGPAIENAAARGVHCFIAAGNTGRQEDVQFPARMEIVLSWGAVDEEGRIAPFSSMGKEVDGAYYGVRILSYGKNGAHLVLSGTSMSTPLASGLFALRLQWEMRELGGITTKTVADVHRWLSVCCRDVGAPGLDPIFGYGIPDAMQAFGPPAVVQPPAPEQPEEYDLTPLGLPLVLHKPAKLGDDVSLKYVKDAN